MPGKVSPDDLLAHVFGRTGADDDSVLQGPAYGEDAAAIARPGALGEGDGDALVVSSDPVSLAASEVGTLGVHVACNDLAASGADPRWLTVVLLLPDEDPARLEAITADVDAAAREVGAAVVGGHSEYVDALERPTLSLTAMGTAERFVPTGGAEPGDRVVLTTGAGIEGTAVLAADFGDELDAPADVRERAAGFLDEIGVVREARLLRGAATAMHDPTEGGVAAGLSELAAASGVRLDVDRDAIPVRDETRALCDAAGVDPLRIFGSGALLATVPDAAVDDAFAALEAEGVEAAAIGTVREADGDPGVRIDGTALEEPVEDALYPLWADRDSS